MTVARVSEINIYPVKGCQGQSLETANVSMMGLDGDREFSIVFDGKWANQKNLPQLRQLSASWIESKVLLLGFPGRGEFKIFVDQGAEAAAIDIYSKEVPVIDMGNDVAKWLSGALGKSVRLVKMKNAIDWFLPLDEFTQVHGKKQSKFVDTSPILITSQSSLMDLNERLELPVSMNRFRSNVTICDLDAYSEDQLAYFDFPSVNFSPVAVCERCVVTNVDPHSGEVSKEPLLTLSKYRKRKNDYAGGIMFGMYVTPLTTGVISLGDTLSV